MDISGPVAILLFFLLLLVDMFFYGFDAAIDNLNEKEILHKAEEEKDRRSVRLSEMVSRPGIYINTVQLVITLINILMGAFYLNIWLQAIDNGLHVINVGGLSLQNVPTGVISGIATVLSFVAMIYILLTFGVLIPRKMASRKPEKWAYACIDPIFWITRLLSPLTGLVNLTAKGILFLFGVRNNVDENDVTEEEIINMVQEGHEQGVIQASEAEMISNIFEYGDKEAQDIMTHRGSIVAIDGETKLKDAIASMLEGKNSRYPVYEENIDHIIGILHLKDAMRFHISDDKLDLPIAKLDGLLREPYFVPQTKNIDELFKEMQSQKLQMVIVVDEYGQTDGLIAMEDILEEIVQSDEKQRYSFSEDGTKIRANQGHSIQVDVELPVTEPPETLYHGTAQRFAASIEAQGLLPQSRLYVHLSPDQETAEKVGRRHGEPVIYLVDAGQMHRDGYLFYLSANGVWLTKVVPATYLKRLEGELKQH